MTKRDCHTLAIIPARQGSKGFPNKNNAVLNGRSLINRAYDQALRLFTEVLITTDVPEVLQHQELYDRPGVQIIERPKSLAGDTVEMSDVIVHALEHSRDSCENICLLQATSPLRSDNDILKGLELFYSGSYAGEMHEMVMAVSEISGDVFKSGWEKDGVFQYFANGVYANSNRQVLPKAFKPNGAFYILAKRTFTEAEGFAKHNIGLVVLPVERSIDIDSEQDLVRASALL